MAKESCDYRILFPTALRATFIVTLCCLYFFSHSNSVLLYPNSWLTVSGCSCRLHFGQNLHTVSGAETKLCERTSLYEDKCVLDPFMILVSSRTKWYVILHFWVWGEHHRGPVPAVIGNTMSTRTQQSFEAQEKQWYVNKAIAILLHGKATIWCF